MANFNTHVTGAAAGAGLLSTLILKAGHVGVAEALLLTLSGTVGGILPDIDLKYSYPSKMVFTVIGTLAALFWMFSSDNSLSVLEIWLLGLGIFLIVRYPLWALFHKFTVHRGSMHSIAAAVMFGLLSAIIADKVFSSDPLMSWLIALLVFVGFIFHLVLDEIYSVDFLGYRIKRSFGSALKLIDLDHIGGSVAIVFICLLAWFYTPDTDELRDRLADGESRQLLFENLLPDYVTRQFKIPQVDLSDVKP